MSFSFYTFYTLKFIVFRLRHVSLPFFIVLFRPLFLRRSFPAVRSSPFTVFSCRSFFTVLFAPFFFPHILFP